MKNIISEEDYGDFFPNFERFSIKDMDEETRETYLFMTSYYRYYLLKYLNKKLDLKRFDEMIEKSNLSFLSVKEENKDVYQFYNLDELNYIYLRNNIHISNFSDEERDELLDLIKRKDTTFDDEIEMYIEKTYKRAISEDLNNKDKITLISYGPDNGDFLALSYGLVIGVRFDEFALNGKSDDEWENIHFEQLEYIQKVMNDLKEKCESELDLNSFVLRYNEFSAEKRIEKKNRLI